MAEVKVVVTGQDNLSATFGKVTGQIKSVESSVNSLSSRITSLVGALGGLYISNKLWEGFTAGIAAVDDFQQSVIKTSAMITSLQGGDNIAENYQKAKEYAEGLQETLARVDSQTSLNLTGLQAITEEMVKQGVVLDSSNAGQVEAFTRLANAAAVYSQNGRNEVQLRQEVRALMMGQVDQNSQLAGMLQRTVDGPLAQQVAKWKESGTLLEELGKHLSGFGPANKDMQNTWSAVKSSMETTINLLLRSGFSDIVKELVQWLGKANDYLKAHQEMIASKIKGAWEEVKKTAELVVPVIKSMYEHASLFVGLFVAGTFVKGLTTALGIYKEIKTVVTQIALIQAGTAVAGAAGAGGSVAAGAVGAATSGGLAVWLARSSKLLNPTTAGLFAAYEISKSRNANDIDDVAMIKDYTRQHQTSSSSSSGSPPPKIDLQDTQDQIKRKIELRDKELAAFKSNQESMTAIAKLQSDIQLADLKGQYNQGTVSTRDYYEKEKRIALEAAQSKLDNAKEYLAKEQQLLQTIRSKMKGTDNPEYQQELAKNAKAQQEVSEAGLDLKKLEITEENKLHEALRARGQEYAKLTAQAQEESGEYVQAVETRIEAEKKAADYLRLQVEALSGVQAAVEALASKERQFATQKQQALIKQNEEARSYTEATARMKDELDALLGKDAERIKAESGLRESKDKLVALEEKLALAIIQENQAAISALQAQINLQNQLNAQKQQSIALSERNAVLSGQIVGFNGNTPIYANGSESGGYDNGNPVPAYQSYNTIQSASAGQSLLGQFISVGDLNKIPFMGGLAVGTNYVPADGYAFLHKGEAVVPKQYNNGSGAGATINLSGGINITVQGGKSSQETVDEIARKIYPAIMKFQGRRLAA